MYTYLHKSIYPCTYIHTYMHTNTDTYKYTYTYTCTFIYTFKKYTCKFTYPYTLVQVYMCTLCTCIHIHTVHMSPGKYQEHITSLHLPVPKGTTIPIPSRRWVKDLQLKVSWLMLAPYGGFHKWVVPQKGWFMRETLTKMDD